MTPATLELDTPEGPARAHLRAADGQRAALVLGHGAGGGVASPDLVTVTEAALSLGISTALVEQPYRVAGRRAPAPPGRLDTAWVAVVARLRGGPFADVPLVVGGRSSGARVACRTSGETAAAAVLCLAFPLRPPRRPGKPPAESRLAELEAVTVPVLVVQGERDPFGVPPEGPGRTVVRIAGNHSLRTDLDALAAAVRTWLSGVLAGAEAGPVA